jgi:hypothetical protein
MKNPTNLWQDSGIIFLWQEIRQNKNQSKAKKFILEEYSETLVQI